MKRLPFVILLLLVIGLHAQPRPKDVIEHAPVLYPEGKWSWLGANARMTVPHGIGFYGADLSEGDLYYDTALDSLFYYTGSSWKAIVDRTRIVALLDSILALRTRIGLVQDTTEVHNLRILAVKDSLAQHNIKLSALRLTSLTPAQLDTVKDVSDSLRHHNLRISTATKTNADQDTAISNHRVRNSAFALSNANEDTSISNINGKVSTLRGYFGDLLGSSGTYQGETIILTAGETMIVGHICYMKSDGKAWRADADSTITMPVMFIATATTTVNTKGIFLVKGRFRLDAWSWSIGGIIFASTTKGLMTQSTPDGTGDQIQGLGIATTTNEILFTPYPILVEK